MQADQPILAPPRAGGTKNVSMILSAVAVVLAAGALVAAVVIPGAAGPAGAAGAAGTNGTNGATGTRGPTGPQGPAGNGTMMGHFIDFITLTLGASCTDEPNVVSLNTPSAGNVTVTASVTVQISHTAGTADSVVIYVSTSAFGGCSDTAGYAWVPAASASDTYKITVPVALASPVAGAGTYVYWVSGIASGSAEISFATGYVVFFPS